MRWHGRRVTVYAYARPTDMRKGFDGLSALVTQGLQRDPLNGDMYIFVSRNRVRAKVLHWDGTGLCIYAKRLERGRFAFGPVSTLIDVVLLTRSAREVPEWSPRQ
jgi:transposase